MFPTAFQNLEKLINDYEQMGEMNIDRPKITEKIKVAAKEILKKELDRGDQKGFNVVTHLIDRVKFTPKQKKEMYMLLAPEASENMINRYAKSKTPFQDFAEQVTINCRGKEIKVSKAELVNLGKSFQVLFNQKMRETSNMAISLNDMTLEEFQAILEFNQDPANVDLHDPETWLAIRTLADRFQLREDIPKNIPDFPKFAKIKDAIDFVRENKLKILDLRQFDVVKDEHLKLVGSLTNLERLVIRSTEITDKGIAHLSGLKELRYLDLKDCDEITDEGLYHLSGLKELSYLVLDDCDKIKDKGLSYLSGLKELRYLSLYRCDKITDEGLSHLKGLKELRDLILSGCDEITDEGLSHLSGLKELRLLHLWGCKKITDTAKALLRKQSIQVVV